VEESKIAGLENLEERKLREIEHSRRRRTILQGYERHVGAANGERAWDAALLIRDREGFKKHFSNMKFYAIADLSEQYYLDWLRARSAGKRVLDYCCGSGENAIFAAQCGGEATGIDISPEGIANARLNAARGGVQENCKFEVMDAEATRFLDNTFDTVIEYGALHHLEFDRAMRELSRILKPDGEMISIEALRHNPFIHFYRKLTPHLRTEWEVNHILRVQDLDRARAYFGEVQARFFHLAALAAVPFRNTRLFQPLRRFLDRLDEVILKRDWIGRYGWIVVFTLTKPRKASGG
jgi:ubiquinone/menaquinone biosynthesis C-methylase UbiE